MVREKIQKAIEGYIDSHRESIREHVDKNLESTKDAIVEKLPEHVIGFLSKHFEKKEGGGNFLGQILTTVTSLAKEMSQEFKDEIRKSTRHHVDKATEGSTDYLTDTAVKESKVAVKAFTSDDDDGKEEKHHSLFRSLDFSFLGEGKAGLVNKVLELIRPPIHRVGQDIHNKMSTSFPKHIKGLLLKEFGGGLLPGGDKDGDGVNDNLQNVLTILGGGKSKGEEGGDILDKVLSRLPEKIHEILQPFIDKFEEGLMQNLSYELHNHVFSEDSFKKGVKSLLNVFGGDDDDGKHGGSGGSGGGGGGFLGFFKKDKHDDD